MNPILFPAPLKIRATYIKIVENKQNVHYLWCHDFLNFDDIFKNDRVRGGLQSVKIKKPPGTYAYYTLNIDSPSYFLLENLKGDRKILGYFLSSLI